MAKKAPKVRSKARSGGRKPLFERLKKQWSFIKSKSRSLVGGERKFRRSWVALGLFSTTLMSLPLLWPARDPSQAAKADASYVEQLTDPLTSEAWAFFHPVWKDDDSWLSLPTSAEENAGLSDYLSRLRHVVTDPKGRVSSEFQVPDYLKERVIFWMLVHSRYSRKVRIVHDRSNPGIIYGYLDYRPLYRVLGATATLEHRAAKIEKQVLSELKGKLLEAAGTQPSRLLNPKDRERIHAFLSRHGALSPERAQALASNLRTQTGQSDEFIAALSRSRSLLPHIESVFRQRGLPVTLGRIPFVESSFNDIAHSKVGAMGIWQFMPATAAELIHRSNRELWADPIAQTKGAARMLKMYRSVLPDWGTTVTSYNSGVGRVRRLLERHRLTGLEGILSLPESSGLGFAGQNFFAQFLSASLVEAYRDELFISTVPQSEVATVLRGEIPLSQELCQPKGQKAL